MSNELIEAHTTSIQIEDLQEKYESIESDLNELHNNLTSAAEKVGNQLPILIDLADAAQNDKIYMALSRVVESFSKLNRDAADIIKQKLDLYNSLNRPDNSNSKTINNDNRSIVFHGTANDLLDKVMERDIK